MKVLLLSLAFILIFAIVAALNPDLDGIYIPSGACPASCCCSSGLPTSIRTSELTDEIIVSTSFNANEKCNGHQSMSAIFSVVDNTSAIWIAPISKVKWQMKWNTQFSLIQLQQMRSDGTVDSGCLNQLKRFTATDDITDMSRQDIASFDMISPPASSLSFSTSSVSNKVTIPAAFISDNSHQIVIEVNRIGMSNRFDFNFYLQSIKGGSSSSTTAVPLNTQQLLNADFMTMHFINPTTLSSDSAVMSSRTKVHCTPVNQGGNNALFFQATLKVAEQTGIRFGITYKLSTIQSLSGVLGTRSTGTTNTNGIIDTTKIFSSKTLFYQNNNSQLSSSSSFTTTSGRTVLAQTMAYSSQYKPESSFLATTPSTDNPNASSSSSSSSSSSGSTSTSTTPSTSTSSPTPKPTTTAPKPTTPADQRELLSGDWKSDGSCKSSASCCCLSPTKSVAMTVYTPQQALAKKIDVEGIDTKNANQIVVVGYPENHATCFGITELKGLCNINFSTKKGTCTMNGINFTSSIDSNNKLHVENSMFQNCVSVASHL